MASDIFGKDFLLKKNPKDSLKRLEGRSTTLNVTLNLLTIFMCCIREIVAVTPHRTTPSLMIFL